MSDQIMLPPHNVAFATRMSRAEQPPKPDDISLEKHYTVDELAELWNLSRETIRRLFQDVPGVLAFGVDASYGRPYITLRIPESVVIRRHRQLSLGRDIPRLEREMCQRIANRRKRLLSAGRRDTRKLEP